MNKEAFELSSQLFDAENSVLSPAYDEIRNKLFGNLATSSMLIDGLREMTTQRIKNSEFLKQFAGLLPSASIYESDSGYVYPPKNEWSVFSLDDAFTMRLIQASTIWNSDIDGEYSYSYYKPYYVVGKNIDPQTPKQTNLILLSANQKSKGLRSLTVLTEDFNELDKYKKKLLTSEPTSEEIKLVYREGDGKIVLEAGSPNITHATRISNWPRKNKLPSEIRAFDQQPQVLTKVGLTDLEIAKFNVPEYINELVTAFGRQDVYKALIDKWEKRTDDSIEEIVAPKTL